MPLLQLAAETLQILGQLAQRQRPGDERGDLVEIERLGQVVVGAALRRLDGIRHRVLRRHHDEEGVDPLLAGARQDVEPGHVGHADVEQGDVEGTAAERLQRLGAARDRDDGVPALRAGALEHPADGLLVVGDEDGAGKARFRGRHGPHSRGA